jgi:hypothetical protein
MTALIPAMTTNEVVLLKSFYESADSYVEFGCGGSTFLAASTVKNHIITVDSDYTWLQKVQNSCDAAETQIRPKICFVDIGPTRELGYPTDEISREKWPSYHERVWSYPDADNADLYLVDGRFRVACAFQVLLRAKAQSILIVHDYISRPHYHFIQPFVQEICRADDLAAFVRRRNFDEKACLPLLQRHRYDFR